MVSGCAAESEPRPSWVPILPLLSSTIESKSVITGFSSPIQALSQTTFMEAMVALERFEPSSSIVADNSYRTLGRSVPFPALRFRQTHRLLRAKFDYNFFARQVCSVFLALSPNWSGPDRTRTQTGSSPTRQASSKHAQVRFHGFKFHLPHHYFENTEWLSGYGFCCFLLRKS
jgi:hypothetical protein